MAPSIPQAGFVDVMILDSHRGMGLGHRLYAAVARDRPILVTLTMALATRKMAERLGAINFGEVKLYSRFSRLDHRTVRRYLQVRTTYHPQIQKVVDVLCGYFLAHRILAVGGSILLSLRDAFVGTPRPSKKTTIAEIDSFGPEIDLLWQRIRHDFPVAFNRDSKFLNWRFREVPQMKYRCFLASRDGRPVGYMILRETEPVELPEGVIVDLLAARQDRETIDDLVAFAAQQFGNRVAPSNAPLRFQNSRPV